MRESASPHPLNQVACNLTVVNFTPSDFKINRMSTRIDGKMNLCSRSTSWFSNCSIFIPPSSTCMLMRTNAASVNEDPFFIQYTSQFKKNSPIALYSPNGWNGCRLLAMDKDPQEYHAEAPLFEVSIKWLPSYFYYDVNGSSHKIVWYFGCVPQFHQLWLCVTCWKT